MSPILITSFALSRLQVPASGPTQCPYPCATAGWGSWGWDLLPITNHIARDFQPTLSSASGATVAAEDVTGDRVSDALPPPMLA